MNTNIKYFLAGEMNINLSLAGEMNKKIKAFPHWGAQRPGDVGPARTGVERRQVSAKLTDEGTL